LLSKNKNLIFIFVILALILGGLSSSNTASDPWYLSLNKSELNPPGYVFGIVWPILYILMAISAYITLQKVYQLFYIQLLFNTAWSWIFFYFQLPLIALVDIYVLIIINIYILFKMFNISNIAAYLYIPYIVWLCFASYLNLFIVLSN
jgi:tryptophan-rich sensory protein